jgi:hypothetical protein
MAATLIRRIILLLIVLALAGPTAPSWASSESNAADVASAVGSALGTLIYAPLKAAFCFVGGVAIGFTAIASPPTAGKVAMEVCGGSWIVTPGVVRGREAVQFVGDTSPGRTTAAR